MFKKRKNVNIRQRRLSEEEVGVEQDGGTLLITEDSNSNPTPVVKKEKKKVKKEPDQPKKQSVLSFEDELEADDGIIFQEKKSSLSYKLRKEMKKERKEKRREEKEKRREAEGKEKKDKNGGTTLSELDELGIKIVNGREAESIAALPGESDESDDGMPGKHKFRPKGTKTSQSLDPWKKILQSGQIPDANMIHAIRKKRQQAREQGDMIPLDDTVRVEETKGRLVRDDDNDRSEDEEGESRMDFSLNQQARDRRQRKEAFDAAQERDSDNSDHDSEWEKQQLLKAGANAKVAGVGDTETQETMISTSGLNNGGGSVGAGGGGGGALGAAVAGEPNLWGTETLIPASSASLPRPANYQAEGIIKRLQDR